MLKTTRAASKHAAPSKDLHDFTPLASVLSKTSEEVYVCALLLVWVGARSLALFDDKAAFGVFTLCLESLKKLRFTALGRSGIR